MKTNSHDHGDGESPKYTPAVLHPSTRDAVHVSCSRTKCQYFTGTLPLEHFFIAIRGGAWCEDVERYRAALASPEDAGQIESSEQLLPSIIMAGVVDGDVTEALEKERFQHSGLLGCSFPGTKVDHARLILTRDPYVIATWVSASGDHMEAIVAIPADLSLHGFSFRSAASHFRAKGLELNPEAENPVFSLKGSYDPNLWINPNAAPLINPHVPGWFKRTPTVTAVMDLLQRIPMPVQPETAQRFEQAIRAAMSEECAEKILQQWEPTKATPGNGKSSPGDASGLGLSTIVQELRALGHSGLSDFIRMPNEAVPFPLHALPPAARDMVNEMVRVSCSGSESLAVASVLGAMSVSLGAGLEMETMSGKFTRPNLFIMGIAGSGAGKGESHNLAFEPFYKAQQAAHEKFKQTVLPKLKADKFLLANRVKKLAAAAADDNISPESRAKAGAEYVDALRLLQELEDKIVAGPGWRVSDITKEAMGVELASQPSETVASISSEARGLIGVVLGRYNRQGSDEDIYTAGFSGDPIVVNRVGREPVDVHRPCISVFWLLQEDMGVLIFQSDALMHSGMLQRFLYVVCKAQPRIHTVNAPRLCRDVSAAWASLITSFVESFHERDDAAFVRVSPAASEVLLSYFNENVERRRVGGDLHDVHAFPARWGEIAYKIALVLHAGHHGPNAAEVPLAAETAYSAVEIMRWFSEQVLPLLARTRHDRKESLLTKVRSILTKHNGYISLRDLRRKYSIEVTEVEPLLKESGGSLRIFTRRSIRGPGSPMLTDQKMDLG